VVLSGVIGDADVELVDAITDASIAGSDGAILIDPQGTVSLRG
jgi:hypothetical protein